VFKIQKPAHNFTLYVGFTFNEFSDVLELRLSVELVITILASHVTIPSQRPNGRMNHFPLR
jgi:hypothetical protein